MTMVPGTEGLNHSIRQFLIDIPRMLTLEASGQELREIKGDEKIPREIRRMAHEVYMHRKEEVQRGK